MRTLLCLLVLLLVASTANGAGCLPGDPDRWVLLYEKPTPEGLPQKFYLDTFRLDCSRDLLDVWIGNVADDKETPLIMSNRLWDRTNMTFKLITLISYSNECGVKARFTPKPESWTIVPPGSVSEREIVEVLAYCKRKKGVAP